ncbi:hypothetical protein OG21DRAFT_1528283 [Imleria badia]|nr:hypothetical protein OG21DRAFT_1528283 [Imleria badia]
MNNTIQVSENNQRIAAAFCSVQYDQGSGMRRGSELREVSVEKESLEAWKAPDVLQQLVSLNSEHTVPDSYLFRRFHWTMHCTLSLFREEFPESTGMIWISRRQLFIRAPKLKKLPPNDRATLLKPLHSSFRQSRVQRCCCCLPDHIGASLEFIVTVFKSMSDPCELRKEVNGHRISTE